MKAKNTFWTNVGITLVVGLYAIIGSVYAEFQKGPAFWNEKSLAFQVTFGFIVAAGAIQCLLRGYPDYDD